MADDGGVTTPQIIGWAVTAAAFGGTMLWNWLNRQHINKTAAAIRSEQYTVDAWSSLRSRIEDRLDRFLDQIEEAPTTIRMIAKNKGVEHLLEDINHKVVLRQDALSRGLADAELSIYAHGYVWVPAALGAVHGDDTSWDLILRKIEDAMAPALPREDRIEALKALRPFATEIENAVRQKIADQEALLHPSD